MPGAPKWFARASVSSVRPRLDSPIRPISSPPETRHHAYRFTHIGAFMSASLSGGALAALSDDLAAAVVTVAAHHTIQRDDDITVTLHDGTTATATLAGRDPSTDLAVLRLEGGSAAPVAAADGAPRVGQLVL